MVATDSSRPGAVSSGPSQSHISPPASDNDASSVQDDAVVDSAGSNTSVSSGIGSPEQTGARTLKSAHTAQRLGAELAALFTESAAAKIFDVAVREMSKDVPPIAYPEYVTIAGPEANKYTMREADFWTCGFFPGSLYAILERSMRFPQHIKLQRAHATEFHTQLLEQCHYWTGPIRAMESRTDTHDLGFIIQPALRMDWELTGNVESLKSIIKAADSLASRYSEKVGAIRSWDVAINDRYSFTDMDSDFLVIIDSMCNLDLLYWAGHQTGNQKLIDLATTHAHTVLQAIVRDDWSTYHLINFDAKTGAIKNQLTNQGHKDWSTWSRGQAWAILGFTQTYSWTQTPDFLHAAISLATYFLSRLSQAASAAAHTHPYVPLWDFDAPPTISPISTSGPLRDTSAGMIAANGMLLLHQILISERRLEEANFFLGGAVRIVKETVSLSLARDNANFAWNEEEGKVVVERTEGNGPGEVVVFDAILRHATANNNEHAHKKYADHGLVYADYYFLELGNKLMRMGLV